MYTLEIKIKCDYNAHRFRELKEITDAVTTVIKGHLDCDEVSAILFYEPEDKERNEKNV